MYFHIQNIIQTKHSRERCYIVPHLPTICRQEHHPSSCMLYVVVRNIYPRSVPPTIYVKGGPMVKKVYWGSSFRTPTLRFRVVIVFPLVYEANKRGRVSLESCGVSRVTDITWLFDGRSSRFGT
jgi:hypothetical protein